MQLRMRINNSMHLIIVRQKSLMDLALNIFESKILIKNCQIHQFKLHAVQYKSYCTTIKMIIIQIVLRRKLLRF